jgi:flagellar biosynthesis/type III secretory pathway protein FliH
VAEAVAEALTETVAEAETMAEAVAESVAETVAEILAEAAAEAEAVAETVAEAVSEAVAEAETAAETVAETVGETVAETVAEIYVTCSSASRTISQQLVVMLAAHVHWLLAQIVCAPKAFPILAKDMLKIPPGNQREGMDDAEMRAPCFFDPLAMQFLETVIEV